ncbi:MULTISPECIES: hypothetical protein [Amycolatopsis]|uniref:Uncharacterized protein n=1 Tax=Amycolatopsis albidoflavus TaxID=102226 RepID=A0ABW5IED2_9PSEU
MYEIPPTAAMRRWAVTIDNDLAAFRCAPRSEGPPDVRVLPRVWPGRGLGVSEADVRGLAAAVAEAMKTPGYWIARRRAGRPWEDQPWGSVHRDAEEGFVYVSGPCGIRGGSAGYRPVSRFPVALQDLRGLRIRLTDCLQAYADRAVRRRPHRATGEP